LFIKLRVFYVENRTLLTGRLELVAGRCSFKFQFDFNSV
jgi:hypothetical protein